MKKFTFLCLFFVLALSSFSQKKRANIWYLGSNAGVDFSTGTPAATAGSALSSPEASAVMCDTSGNLLFYTDAVNVWDKNNNLMANGTGLLGGTSTTQGALIVPWPGNDSLYYLFTLDEIGGPNGLRYSIVNMKGNGGLGVVTSTKNVYLSATLTEKLTGVQDPYSNSYWVMAHQWGGNTFEKYKITTAGLQPVAYQGIGMMHTNTQIQNTYGQMKFNACGNRLGYAAGYLNQVEVYDFNTTTGTLSNAINIPMTDKVYGFEFSSDGNIIYVSTYDPMATMVQYDLSSGVQSTIIASKQILSTTPSIYGVQMANNGKIYFCKSFDQFLGVINFPNVMGAGCGYNDMGIDLDPTFMGYMSNLGTPNFVTSFMHQVQFACPVVSSVSEIASNGKTVSVAPNPSAGEFSMTTTGQAVIEVFATTGQLVEHIDVSSAEKVSFGKNYAKGIYLVRLQDHNGTATSRIVKE